MEIAKLRAARILWAQIVEKYSPKNQKSKILRTHCQTSGWSLTEQDPYNNIIRTTIEAMAAVFGGTQSLHTNSFDEATALPSEFSSKIAVNTQLILQKESNITKTVDPWGGSYMMESLTQEIIEKVLPIMSEIEKDGGMINAIESGIPKMNIEKSAAERQAKIDSNQESIIGVNEYISENNEEIETLEIDNHTVLEMQIKKLTLIKSKRDNNKVATCLKSLSLSAKNNDANLLELSIEAIRARCTIGEISLALEDVWGRYSPNSNTVTGVYKQHIKDEESWNMLLKQVEQFEKTCGRRPRILMAKMGQDGHDRGTKVIASAFSDLGFDVDLSPLFSIPSEVAKQAIENDVHIIGVSSQAAGHKTLIPQLIKDLKRQDANDIMIIAGGVIPKKDYQFLYNQGVSLIFGPGTAITDAAKTILEKLLELK